MPSYKVLNPISYPPDKNAWVDDVVSDIPASSVEWLLEYGIIEPAAKSTKKTADPVIEEEV